MRQWHIKERNHSLSLSYITKSESRSDFFFYFPSVLRCSCLSVVKVHACLNTVLPVCPYVPSPIKGLCSLFYWAPQNVLHGEKEQGYFTGMFNKVCKELSHWLQLSPTDTDNKYHCLSNNSYMLSSFMAYIPFVRLL